MQLEIHGVELLASTISGQPYGVWYPLVLVGVILTVVMGALLPVIRKRYTEVEARRFSGAALRKSTFTGISPVGATEAGKIEHNRDQASPIDSRIQ